MGKSKIRTLLLASLTIMLCVAMLIGGTYALWSDDFTVVNHLSAGTLKVKLVRTDLQQWKLDENGIVSPVEISAQDKQADFTKAVTETLDKYKKNVFGLEDTETIAPTSKYVAKMLISNNGGSVSFDYNVYIKLNSTTEITDQELAEQIKVTVLKQDGTEESKFLSDCVTDNGYKVASGKVLVNSLTAQAEFTVTIEFVNDTTNGTTFDNDEAQGKKASFDLFVTATQATSVT